MGTSQGIIPKWLSNGIPGRWTDAVYWYRKGAEAGDRFCMIKLAEGYRYGRLGLPKNQAEADRWYEAAFKAKKPGEW